MKSSFWVALFLLAGYMASAQTSTFTTTFKFAGIEDGYDHICKTQVWINGTLAGESTPAKQSEGGTITVQVPYGEQRVLVTNYAQYEGEWEEHTIDNNYSIDCMWQGTHVFDKKPAKFFLLFDIDNGTSVSWKKMPSKPKK